MPSHRAQLSEVYLAERYEQYQEHEQRQDGAEDRFKEASRRVERRCKGKQQIGCCLTDSYSSWQKGAVENTNKLIRQYIPKGMDISTVSDKRIASIQAKINKRPRAKLNFNTPKEEFFKHYS